MKNRTTWEIAVASIIFLIIGVAYYIIRQRLRLQRERTDRYLLLAEEANTQYKTLTEHMEGQRNAESHLKGLVASRFDIIDKLGKTYYERENTASQQAAMFHEVKQIITDFAENNAMFQELELIVNTCHDNAMEKLRNDFPSMKEADIRLLCYIFVGFSPQVISLFMVACEKGNEEMKEAKVVVSVYDENGKIATGVPVKMYNEKDYKVFEKDNLTLPTAIIQTNESGMATFVLPREEWFATQSQRFLTFVVQEGGGPDNYQIWSSGKTVEAGKAVKVEIRLTQFPN